MDLLTGVFFGSLAASALGCAVWEWSRRRVKPPEIVHLEKIESFEVVAPPPPVTIRMLQFGVNAAVGPEPIDGVGWLAPDGEFHGNGPGNHYDCAYRLLDRESWLARKPLDPSRNYERELEQTGYIKLLRNAYFYGWTRPAKWRMSRPQQEELVNWYTMHARPMPDWLKEMIAV